MDFQLCQVTVSALAAEVWAGEGHHGAHRAHRDGGTADGPESHWSKVSLSDRTDILMQEIREICPSLVFISKLKGKKAKLKKKRKRNVS